MLTLTISIGLLWGLAVLVPGPDTLMIMNIAMRAGRCRALSSVAGIVCGTLIFWLAGFFGVAALFYAAPWSYHALRIGGALYLIHLGRRMIRTDMNSLTRAAVDAPRTTTISTPRAFCDWGCRKLVKPQNRTVHREPLCKRPAALTADDVGWSRYIDDGIAVRHLVQLAGIGPDFPNGTRLPRRRQTASDARLRRHFRGLWRETDSAKMMVRASAWLRLYRPSPHPIAPSTRGHDSPAYCPHLPFRSCKASLFLPHARQTQSHAATQSAAERPARV